MITKLIGVVFIVGFLFVGWEIFLYWDKVSNERELKEKKEAAALVVVPDQLRGMPYELQSSYDAARKQGLPAMTAWLQAYGNRVQDPRRGWIEIDYVLLLSRDNPAEAKRIFNAVKARTPTNSPVWPRVKKLEKTYE